MRNEFVPSPHKKSRPSYLGRPSIYAADCRAYSLLSARYSLLRVRLRLNHQIVAGCGFCQLPCGYGGGQHKVLKEILAARYRYSVAAVGGEVKRVPLLRCGGEGGSAGGQAGYAH